MSTHVRPAWTLGASKKRKDRPDSSEAQQPAQVTQVRSAQQAKGDRLLAGYFAHEYLTQGTLFGKPVGTPSRPEPEARKVRDLNMVPESSEPVKPAVGVHYAEVSRLLMRADGAHVPGVVNPTQLARWLEM